MKLEREDRVQESEIKSELEEQIQSYLELCAMYEKTPSVLAFAQHLIESYEEKSCL